MSTQIELTRGHFATIDDADASVVQQRLWQAVVVKGHVYAASSFRDGVGTGAPCRKIYLHHFILGRRARPMNGNPLDCRRANLAVYGDADAGAA